MSGMLTASSAELVDIHIVWQQRSTQRPGSFMGDPLDRGSPRVRVWNKVGERRRASR